MLAPSADDIAEMAQAVLAAFPEPFRAHAAEVAIVVQDFADEDVLSDLEIEDPFDLTGLYTGIALTEKSVMDQAIQPDAIWLFRRPILEEWTERGNEPLGTLVRHIVVHEIAHHFGWSDEDIARIDRWWE